MAWFLKKSFSLGRLFRLNFSKSGVGVSVGVKGARVGVGPKGKYATLGREGVYFRKSLESGGRETAAPPVDAGSTGTDERVRRLVSDRSAGWEYLLFAEALDRGLEATRSAYQGGAEPVGAPISSEAALSETGALMEVITSSCARVTDIMNGDLQVAAGPPGSPGDQDALVQAAFAIAHEYTLLNDARFRAHSLRAQTYFEPIKTQIGRAIDGLCARVDAIPGEIRGAVGEAVQGRKSVKLSVVFEVENADDLVAASQQAMEGVKQEHGL